MLPSLTYYEEVEVIIIKLIFVNFVNKNIGSNNKFKI